MQFTDEDLEAAVAAGAMAPEVAEGFRAYVEGRRAAPSADEESFRLLTGFNDIFVSIAWVMSLVALGWLGLQFFGKGAGALVALASWGLAEFFTRVRRMALPSILLLFAFVGGVVATTIALMPQTLGDTQAVVRILGTGAIGAFAAFLHWRRFMVPVTVAAGALTIGGAVVLAVAAGANSATVALCTALAAGLLTFAFALAWDTSDRLRKTRRSDVAFWLHLIAAPAIVNPAFSLLGLSKLSLFGAFAGYATANAGAGSALAAFGLYAVLGVVALVVDRRALMVSSLAYLLVAMDSLFRATGALTLSIALSALVVGAGLLLLSAFWATARRGVLRLAPAAWRARLPPAT